VATADWHEDRATFRKHPTSWTAGPALQGWHPRGALPPAAGPALEHVEAVFRKESMQRLIAASRGYDADDKRLALAQWLRKRAIEQVEIAGLATDHCSGPRLGRRQRRV